MTPSSHTCACNYHKKSYVGSPMYLHRSHRMSFYLSLMILAAWAWCPQPASAGSAATTFRPVAPEELQMATEPNAPGAPAIILYRQVIRDDTGNTAHEDNYFRIKILTEEGRKYGDVEILYETGLENVVGIHARTIKPDGSVADFDGK